MFFQRRKEPSITVVQNNLEIILSRGNTTDKILKKCLSKCQDGAVSSLCVNIDKLTSLSGEILEKFILQQKFSLKRLRITKNTLVVNCGVNKLASVLNDCNIEELDLTNNRITTNESLDFFKKLKGNQHVKRLNLSSNRLSDKIFSEIIDVLKVNSTLEYLSLEKCGLSQYPEKVEDLLRVARENKSLIGIGVMFNDLPYTTVSKFEKFSGERRSNSPATSSPLMTGIKISV